MLDSDDGSIRMMIGTDSEHSTALINDRSIVDGVIKPHFNKPLKFTIQSSSNNKRPHDGRADFVR